MSNSTTDQLKQYFTLYRSLQERGGPEEDEALFEQCLLLQEEILAHFGLPPADRYRQIFWKFTEAGSLTTRLLAQTESRLKKAAEKYLSRPAQTDLELLTQARTKKLDPFDVLPELGHPTHDYTFYLYRVLLLQDLASPEEVLEELNRIKEINAYKEIATLKFDTEAPFDKSDTYRKYKPLLRYLDGYLAYEEADEYEEE